MSTQEPTRSSEDHHLVSAEALPTDFESTRVAFRRIPIPASSCAMMRLKRQRNPASFAAHKTPDESSFAMGLVVPCASLAHELGEQLHGPTPAERDLAITAQDPSQHDACAEEETACTTLTTAATRVTSNHKTSASYRHICLGNALIDSGAAYLHQLMKRPAMAGTPCEHSSSETLTDGRPTNIINDARRRQRPDAVNSDDDDRLDVGNDAQRPRHRLREELVEYEVERLIGLGVLTQHMTHALSRKVLAIIIFCPEAERDHQVRFRLNVQ